MTVYKRRKNRSATDIFLEDQKQQDKEIFDDLKTFFDKLKPQDLQNHSEAFIERKRMGKSNFPTEKYRQEAIDREYLNFDKYEKNRITHKDLYDEIEEDYQGLPI